MNPSAATTVSAGNMRGGSPRTVSSTSVAPQLRQVPPPPDSDVPTLPPPALPDGTGSSNPGASEYDASLTDFLKRWKAADRKQAIVEELDAEGLPLVSVKLAIVNPAFTIASIDIIDPPPPAP